MTSKVHGGNSPAYCRHFVNRAPIKLPLGAAFNDAEVHWADIPPVRLGPEGYHGRAAKTCPCPDAEVRQDHLQSAVMRGRLHGAQSDRTGRLARTSEPGGNSGEFRAGARGRSRAA